MRSLVTLEAHGLVSRRPDTKDLRRSYVELTPKGSRATSLYMEYVGGDYAAAIRRDVGQLEAQRLQLLDHLRTAADLFTRASS